MYMFYLYTSLCAICITSQQEGQEKALDPMEQEQQMTMSFPVGKDLWETNLGPLQEQ